MSIYIHVRKRTTESVNDDLSSTLTVYIYWQSLCWRTELACIEMRGAAAGYWPAATGPLGGGSTARRIGAARGQSCHVRSSRSDQVSSIRCICRGRADDGCERPLSIACLHPVGSGWPAGLADVHVAAGGRPLPA